MPSDTPNQKFVISAIGLSQLQKVACVLCALQAIALLITFVGVRSYAESILFTGPVLAFLGLALAIATWSVQSWRVLAFGLSFPMWTAVVAAMIAAFHIGPGAARTFVPIMLAIYLLVAAPLAVAAWGRILSPPAAGRNTGAKSTIRWRFSTAFLLKLTTALAIFLALARGVVFLLGRNEYAWFAAYAAIVSAACGLTIVFFARSYSPRSLPRLARHE